MKIEFLKKEIIKPSSPTPSELKHFNLSLLDQSVASFCVPLILFFDKSDEERSNRLKKSLSETLTRFYPVAGRGKDNNSSIDCNDEGVDYIEAQVNCLLSDFLKQPNPEQLFHFLPESVAEAMASSGSMLKVQVTLFECGGMAIGLLFAHKLVDASSITTILKSWSMTALGSNIETEPAEFMQASHIQPPEGISIPPMNKEPTLNCITQRIVFNSPKLNNLKSKASSSETIRNPTRVEAVTSLIWKCAMKAAAKTTTTTNLSVITHVVNLRKRLTPPLSENSIGNLLGTFDTKPVPLGEKDLKELVQLLREGISEFNKNGIERYQGEDAFMKIIGGLQVSGALMGKEDVASYIFSSWSRFGLYDMDFGWGKPKWVSSGSTVYSNFVVLMDMKDGEGIEAWVTLKEEEMALFEKDEELLQFAYVNPSVIL